MACSCQLDHLGLSVDAKVPRVSNTTRFEVVKQIARSTAQVCNPPILEVETLHGNIEAKLLRIPIPPEGCLESGAEPFKGLAVGTEVHGMAASICHVGILRCQPPGTGQDAPPLKPLDIDLVENASYRDDATMNEEASEHLALRVHMMPRDTNPFGSVFGGVILSLIDQAGFDEARRHGRHRWVTVAFRGVEFKRPVLVGDRVSLYTTTIKTGKSSVEVAVRVAAHRYTTDDIVDVTSAQLTMVSVDENCRSIPFSSPATLDSSDGNGDS